MALRQASRDTVLSLKTEINTLLQKIIAETVAESLSAENLVSIISEVATKSIESQTQDQDIKIFLNPKDQKKLKEEILSKLQKIVKTEIEVKTSEDIGKGFAISFDGGKSSFEFTDKSLAEYLSNFLNSELSTIVNSSIE